MKNTLLAALAGTLLGAAALPAQDPQVFGELVQVELVLVDVLVEDKDGQPRPGTRPLSTMAPGRLRHPRAPRSAAT